jgi:protein-S-isoprenylcysteine O-methyltransferase Ste14
LYWALILRRVVAEDRFLQANLDGYAQYAVRVRSRVIPGVW